MTHTLHRMRVGARAASGDAQPRDDFVVPVMATRGHNHVGAEPRLAAAHHQERMRRAGRPPLANVKVNVGLDSEGASVRKSPIGTMVDR